jgi:hypothetical protein
LCDNGMFNEYGATGAIKIGRWNQRTWRKPAPLQLFSPKIPYDLTWDKTQGIMVGSQQLLCGCTYFTDVVTAYFIVLQWKEFSMIQSCSHEKEYMYLKLHFKTCLLVS